MSDLSPYSGPWTYTQAAHLLRRATFGPSNAQIKSVVAQGLEATLDQLFEELPMPAPPVNSYYSNDINVPIGNEWHDEIYIESDLGNQLTYRFRSLTAWTLGQIWQEGVHIREKMTLFWHNHFPVNAIEDPKFLYRYGTLLRQYALGNFRDLTKDITIDPAMLRYLNGNDNEKESPNENYARELLELFTVGKGPLAGPGDYTNYNENDVKEMARVLSGWRDQGLTDFSGSGVFSEFKLNEHDTGIKVLSFHFNNAIIPNLGKDEYKKLIDIIFEHPQTSRFICRELYRWFVFHEIDDEVENNVIKPMAQILVDNDYNIASAVRALLASEHFYDGKYMGLIIKNPIDFIMSVLKTLEVEYSTFPVDKQYASWYRIWGFASGMQMAYYEVPEVAGWQAYYREPLYYRNWLNASTLPIRMQRAEDLLVSGYFPFEANGDLMIVEPLKLLDSLDNPLDPNAVVEECVRLLFARPISAARKEALKEFLVQGLPDFEWTVEYQDYLANPGNSSVAGPVEAKIRNLLKAMFSMPDFSLS